MLPTTVVVALLGGFRVSTTIFGGGVATLCFIIASGGVPSYFGASFFYLPALIGLMSSAAFAGFSPADRIAYAQFGVIVSGLVSIAAGLLLKNRRTGFIAKLLPPVVTGPFTIAIGLSLAANALHEASHFPRVAPAVEGLAVNMAWLISLATLLAIVLFTVYLRGIWGQLALFLGPVFGCITAFIILEITGLNFFEAAQSGSSAVFALPVFSWPKPSLAAAIALAPIALVTIPESLGNIKTLGSHVETLRRNRRDDSKPEYNVKPGRSLIADGIADLAAGALGAPAGVSSEENIEAMADSKVFSVPVFVCAALIAMALACFPPLTNALSAVPIAVIGGLEIFHLGALAAHGVSVLKNSDVNLHDPRCITVIAVILIVAVGGQYHFNGSIPFFGLNIPSLAGAASLGILLNLVFGLGKTPKYK